MAKEEATLLLKIKATGSKVLDDIGKAFKSLGSRVKTFSKDLVQGFKNSFVITAGDVVNAVKKIVGVFTEYLDKGSQFKEVQNSFRNMAAAQGQDADMLLEKMKKLSDGTVSELNLMKQANQALMLGLPVERFGDMLNIARSSAKATGQSMDYMLTSIVTGLGRGSKLMLDNLGIVFDINKAYEEYARKLGRAANSLTDAEKKQAFINKALEIGSANAKAAGSAALSSSERWQQVAVKFDDIATKLSTRMLPLMEKLADASMTVGEGLGEMLKDFSKEDSLSIQMEMENLRGELTKLEAQSRKFNAGFMGGDVSSQARITEIKARINELAEFKKAADARELEQEEKKNKGLLAKQEILAEEQRLAKRDQAQKDLQDDLDLQEQKLEMIGMNAEQKAAFENELQLKEINQKLKNEEDYHVKQRKLAKKAALLEKIRKQKEDEETLKARDKFLSQMSSLQSSNNALLAAAGKAAAIAQISISTPEAAAQGYKWGMALGGPGLAAAFQGLAYAAGAANIAKVAGVKLAEGGIVMPTQGGTQATIGEGGRAEAVIPLPDNFDPDSGGVGGRITINFNGVVMGDEEQARRFVREIDNGLLKLRQNNESVAFDAGTF